MQKPGRAALVGSCFMRSVILQLDFPRVVQTLQVGFVMVGLLCCGCSSYIVALKQDCCRSGMLAHGYHSCDCRPSGCCPNCPQCNGTPPISMQPPPAWLAGASHSHGTGSHGYGSNHPRSAAFSPEYPPFEFLPVPSRPVFSRRWGQHQFCE